MALNKIIVIFGIAAFVMQPINSASIGAPNGACICTREYFPICGSDDITYSNNCEFDCAKVRNGNLDIKFYGECEDEFKPQVEDLSDIEQVDECVCTFVYDPVCGSDGNTYSSECEFNCAKKMNKGLEVFTRGECIEIKQLPIKSEEFEECVCTFVYDPVCGSDGNTYSSECEFNCAKRMNKGLEVFTKGECSEVKTLPVEQDLCICTMEYEPVCGSDGRTYSSNCLLGCEQRIRSDLKTKHIGEC